MDRLSRITHQLRDWLNQVRQIPSRRMGRRLRQIAYHSIFWGWNALFLLVVYLGILPFVGVPLLVALVAGDIPFPFVVPLAGMMLVPPACTGFGLMRLRKQPTALMRLFYGVEAPVMALCILRLFILRELTPASTLVIVASAIALTTVAIELVFGYAAYNRGLAWFQMAAHTVVLIMGCYVGAILLFYTTPITFQFFARLVQLDWLVALVDSIRWGWGQLGSITLVDLFGLIMTGIAQSLIIFWMMVLVGFSTTLFVIMPYALVVTFVGSWRRIRHAFGQQYGTRSAGLVTAGVAMVCGLLVWSTSPQPQTQAFALLAAAPDSTAARQELIQRSPQIRQGLVNAYLMPYRYLSPWQQANNLATWYPRVLPITNTQARQVQTWHNTLLSPFLYRGEPEDGPKAARLYGDFFDTPIQKAEADAIQHALQSTVNRDSVEASLLNIRDRVVALARQEVTVQPQGDWAEVTLYERYENLTRDDQEIIYQFSLPESAVITGLWLGESDLPERYRFVVSPRGAAQQVYQQEIERAQSLRAEDPALLEQVGPRQYRLRVFPIPRRVAWGQPGITHLWMTYQVLQTDGAWPLPQLTEKRNVYWTPETERYRLGHSLTQRLDAWYETAILAQQPAAPAPHQVTTRHYQVTATPTTPATQSELEGQRLAIIIDTTRSMEAQREALDQALADSQALTRRNSVDWYVTSAAGMAPQRLTPEARPAVAEMAFYGNLSLPEQLQQFEALRQGTRYDAVLLLTDSGNYELENDDDAIPPFPGSLWLVHLGERVPTAYPDRVQQRLDDSYGGIATRLEEVANRIATEQQIDGTLVDGYRWQVTPGASTGAIPPVREMTADDAPGFLPLATRQAIRWFSRTRDMTDVDELDAVHAIAQQREIVTPYSSMLVLVNERQRAALEAAENSGDRFARELETGEDTLTQPGNPLNAVRVPESGSTLGLLLAGGVMGWIWRRSRPLKARPTHPE